MCGQSLRKVGQGVLELLVGNDRFTDRQADRPTGKMLISQVAVRKVLSLYVSLIITYLQASNNCFHCTSNINLGTLPH